MKGADKTAAQRFLSKVESRIAFENLLASAPGIKTSAREAAAQRAAAFSSDLTYIRAFYLREPVMVGEGDER